MKLPAPTVERLRALYSGVPVCVTGGAGFIGGHLVDALLSMGAVISVVDDLSNSALDHLAGLIELEPQRVRFIHASILDDAALDDAICGKGADGSRHPPAQVIFHHAALGSVPRSIAEPQYTWSVNTTGTVRVLEAARRAGSRRVVFAASSSAYGDQAGGGAKVETQLPQPLSPYAASKLASEHLLSVYALCYGLSTVCLRYFNIFGPRQPADSAYAAAVAAITRRILDGNPPIVFGDGRQTRDFTYIGNAVLATLLAGAAETKFNGEVINVGTGRRVSIIELSEMIARACGAPGVQPSFQPARAGDPRDSLADITRARQLLGYEPVTSTEDGLIETVAWAKRALAGA